MSGTTLLVKPLPPPVSEFVYESVLEIFGLKDLSPADRIKALLEIPAEKLATSIPPTLPLLPVVDQELIFGPTSFKEVTTKQQVPGLYVPGHKWCEELLIGDCQFDVSFSVHPLS